MTPVILQTPETALQCLRAAGLPSDPRLAALSRFTGQVLQARGRAGDGAVDAFLAAGFTRANVLDVVTIIAAKTISDHADHLTHTPKKAFMADPALAWTASAA